MTYYYKLGQVTHKRHTQFRQPNGALYHEEVMGIHGFAGIQSILYHIYPPTAVRQVELETKIEIPYEDGGPLRHRHFRTAPIPPGGANLAFGDILEFGDGGVSAILLRGVSLVH